MEKKLQTSVDSLTKGLPNEFAIYLTYCRNMRFDEKPDYAYLRQILKELFAFNKFEMDYVYDWNILAEQKRNDKDKNDIVNLLLSNPPAKLA